MGRLDNKVALISGAGSGIGKETAKLFAKEGANIHLIGRTEKSLRDVSKDLRCKYLVCDISNQNQVEETVSKILSEYKNIDILVNNAGIILDEGELTNLSEENLDEILAVNLKGTIFLSKYVLRNMESQMKGSIINIASLLGIIGTSNLTAYSASKGVLIAAIRAMAVEHAPYNIRVNSISPSVIMTPLINNLFEINPDLEKRLLSSHPMHKFGELEDVASAILYLASDESKFINGYNLILDGGRSIYDH